jgi:diguanylate cyclase (GGDEF)-like protein
VTIPSKKNIIIRITVIIALVEFVIMIGLANFPFNIWKHTEAILDVVLLVLLSTPVIYIWIIKPYVVAHDDAIYKISSMAYHDPLTKLANRRLLIEYLKKLMSGLARGESYGALLFIGLDGFKAINDKNGHDFGDATLIEVAKRLNSLVRNEDLVSRIGGDEFIVVLSQLGTDEQQAKNKAQILAERILKELNKQLYFKNTFLQVGSSIGLRLLAPEIIHAEIVLTDADTAMYHAKQAGKGRIVVFENEIIC